MRYGRDGRSSSRLGLRKWKQRSGRRSRRPAGGGPRWRTGLPVRRTRFPPRVFVTRLWQHHFGRGLVATASDFGLRGEPPTHPELLDWLATELVARGWGLKAIHRLMLL